MKPKSMIVVLICLASFSFIDDKINWATINWVEKLEADFSFKNKWSYPEGIFRNRFGQLSCDGICPPAIDRMKDHNSKIYLDSLQAFYQVVDTTHLFHSIKSEAWAYEWFNTNFITFKKQADSTTIGQTACNVSTHSSLNIKIKDSSFTAWIDYNSIREIGRHKFLMERGQMSLDKHLFHQGIMKAEFDITFKNTLDTDKRIYWKGLIYCKIEEL